MVPLSRGHFARRVCLVLLVFALAGAQATAHADDAKAQLTWSAPETDECRLVVTAETIEREVEQLVGHPIFVRAGAQADVFLRGGTSVAPVGLRAWLEARDAAGALVGRRELSAESGDCVSLQHSTALVLSVLLSHPSGAAGPPAERRERAARPASGGVGAAVLYGPLPHLAPGFWLSAELGLTSWLRVRADAGYWLPVAPETEGRVGGSMSAFTGGLSLCPAWSGKTPPHRLRFGACVGGQLGAILALPVGLDGPQRAARLLALATLEAVGAVRVQRRSTLFVAAGPTLALTRPRFYYTVDDAPVDFYRPTAYGLIARLGLTIGAP